MRTLLAIILIAFHINFVFAETEAELKDKMETINKEIKALEAEISSYSTKVSKTQGEAKTLKAALLKLENQKKNIEIQVSYTKLQVKKTEKDIISTQNSIVVTSQDVKKQKDGIRELLQSLSTNQKIGHPFLSLLSGNGTLSDSYQIIFHADKVNAELTDKKNILTETKNTLETAKQTYEKKNKDLSVLQNTLLSEQEIVKETAEEKNSLLLETKNKEAEYQKMITQKKNKKNDLEKEMNDFEAKLKAVIDASKIPKYGTGALSYPVEKVLITQYFGNTPFATANSQVYNGHGHNGIDFGIPVGTKILSAGDGVILGTGNTDIACSGASYGKWVFIKHTNGLSTLYAHLSSFLVSTGQTVKTGDIIALSGNTGYSTGPHLHFTVYASDAVHITSPTEYKSKACGTYIIMPVSPISGYLNPLTFFK